MKVLLIGNGPSALEVPDTAGEIIDTAFDKVCRFNCFSLDGFQHKLGIRTDYWVINQSRGDTMKNLVGFLLTEVRPEIGSFLMMGAYRPPGTWSPTGGEFPLESTARSTGLPIEKISFETVLQASQDSEMYPQRQCTTGLAAVYHFLARGDDVYILGFDTIDPGPIRFDHFWGGPQSNMPRAHKPTKEGEILRNLLFGGKIKLFYGSLD